MWLGPSRYKVHSFRIGAASHGAYSLMGFIDAQIRILGRWKLTLSSDTLEYPVFVAALPSRQSVFMFVFT